MPITCTIYQAVDKWSPFLLLAPSTVIFFACLMGESESGMSIVYHFSTFISYVHRSTLEVHFYKDNPLTLFLARCTYSKRGLKGAVGIQYSYGPRIYYYVG